VERDKSDTLRTCEACGETPFDPSYLCPWCTEGYQNREQRNRWYQFRVQRRNLSETYKLLEMLIEEFMNRLKQAGLHKLAEEGGALIAKWTGPELLDREDLTAKLVNFQRRSLDALGSSLAQKD
jgi:hypothetical protein